MTRGIENSDTRRGSKALESIINAIDEVTRDALKKLLNILALPLVNAWSGFFDESPKSDTQKEN